MNYKIIDLVQGSEPWLQYRLTKISATDTGVILGLNPWKTPLQLYEEKLGLRELQPVNDKMREGTLLEEEARKFINEKCLENNFKPIVLESLQYPFMMASLDGYDEKRNHILEIKCGKGSHELALKNEVPPYYFSQCQKQIFVSGLNKVTYFSYRSDNDHYEITIKRDDAYIENMIKAEKEFFDRLMNFNPPSATDRDFIKRNDDLWNFHTKEYQLSKQEKEKYQQLEDVHRNILISLCDGQSSQGNGIRVSKTMTKGRVKYDAIPELKEIDLEKYRGKPVTSYRFTEKKGKDE